VGWAFPVILREAQNTLVAGAGGDPVESDWSASGTDTGIFNLIGLPSRFDKSREFCELEVKVWMGDDGNVENYTRSSCGSI
jgi:hypothetical protein